MDESISAVSGVEKFEMVSHAAAVTFAISHQNNLTLSDDPRPNDNVRATALNEIFSRSRCLCFRDSDRGTQFYQEGRVCPCPVWHGHGTMQGRDLAACAICGHDCVWACTVSSPLFQGSKTSHSSQHTVTQDGGPRFVVFQAFFTFVGAFEV